VRVANHGVPTPVRELRVNHVGIIMACDTTLLSLLFRLCVAMKEKYEEARLGAASA
jgi:hypothetical protein